MHHPTHNIIIYVSLYCFAVCFLLLFFCVFFLVLGLFFVFLRGLNGVYFFYVFFFSVIIL